MNSPSTKNEVDHVASFDGTVIAARRRGAEGGLPLLVANGVGANESIWRRALIDVARSRPIVLWDHRGLYSSEEPRSDRIDAGAHAEDAVAVLDHYGIERCSVASWSSGTRIGLEIASRYPERIEALVLINGGYGHSLRRVVRYREFLAALPTVAGVAKHFSGLMQGPFRALISRPELAGIVRQSGMVAASADVSALVDLLRGMASCDLKRLLAIYEAVEGDAAPDLLNGIQSPTLLIAGKRDQFTSLALMEKMERAIPNAKLIVYHDATHYLPIEYPARMSDDLRSFLPH